MTGTSSGCCPASWVGCRSSTTCWTGSGYPALIAGALPPEDARVQLAPAVAIRLVVTNLVLGREPRYGLGEWAARCDPAQVVVSFAAANRDEAVFPDPNVFE